MKKNYFQVNALPDTLKELNSYVYSLLLQGVDRSDLSQINTDMRHFHSGLMVQMTHWCNHKNLAEVNDLVYNIRRSVVALKDATFDSMTSRQKTAGNIDYLRALYSGLRTIKTEIERHWHIHCCSNVKVPDRRMKEIRHDMYRQYRLLRGQLTKNIHDTALIQLALQPIEQLLSRRREPVILYQLEQIQAYIQQLENLLPALVNGVFIRPKNQGDFLDHLLIPILVQSGYFTAAQLPDTHLQDTAAAEETLVDAKTKRRPRMLLNNTVTFIGGLLRVFKEVDFVGNSNMAEVKRLLVAIFYTPTTQQTTEEALDQAYKNISTSTRKNLIEFLKQCIHWLEKNL